jgi:hypothetical protein
LAAFKSWLSGAHQGVTYRSFDGMSGKRYEITGVSSASVGCVPGTLFLEVPTLTHIERQIQHH